MTRIDRRHLLAAGVSLLAVSPVLAAAGSAPSIHVVKGRGCGCCSVWADILRSKGFDVSEEERVPGDLARLKTEKGIPSQLASCHTADIDGYVIEGHVPASDIRRLLAERPDAIGLSVPGMPYGSPGMGPEDQREAYEVLLIRKDGATEVFSAYAAAS